MFNCGFFQPSFLTLYYMKKSIYSPREIIFDIPNKVDLNTHTHTNTKCN